MNPLKILLILSFLSLSTGAWAVTAYFQDGTELNGTATPGMPAQPYSSTSTFPPGANTIVTDFVYSNGTLADPSGYAALSVGNTYGGSAISRTVLDIDLTRLTSPLSPAPAGFCYMITDLRLDLEVSGSHPNSPPLDFYLGNQGAGQPALGSPMATQTGYTTSFTFVSASLPVSSLGTTDPTALASNYVVTIASALEGDGRFVNLGSSIGPNSWSNSGQGTQWQFPNPRLEIDYELVEKPMVPEPARALLIATAVVMGLTRRHRLLVNGTNQEPA